jgi:hypothetical protein
MKVPSVAPITIERNSPAPARHSEAAPLVTSSPLLTRSTHAAITSLSGGSASVETRPSRALASQASASSSSGEYRSSAFMGAPIPPACHAPRKRGIQ